jgi:hypothetical protein
MTLESETIFIFWPEIKQREKYIERPMAGFPIVKTSLSKRTFTIYAAMQQFTKEVKLRALHEKA